MSLSSSCGNLWHCRLCLIRLINILLVGIYFATSGQSQTFDPPMLRRTNPAAFAVRIVSYNVLSSHLASPSHFSTLDPVHLDAANRLPKILKKLEEELDSDKKIVFCLQEVSHDWAGKFHTFFANRGYHMITGLYGRKFNGYMGVALAYPTSTFETVNVDISQLSDKRVDGWPVEPERGLVTRAVQHFQSLMQLPLKILSLQSNKKKPIDPWTMSENRKNILLTATLRDKESGQAFCVANYHMPCAFYAPMVMSIHADLAARHIQDLATIQSLPYILAGDWNSLPDSSTYQLLTTAKLDRDDPSYPNPKHGMEWAPSALPLKSAYAESSHGEPDFTNYARIRQDDPFIGTLDYIFLSKEWRTVSVKPVVHRDLANGPYPNQQEPSDHVVIAADLELW